MIHAWVDLVLKVEEGHGPNFYNRMEEINSSQTDCKVTIHHSFPLLKKIPASCPSCKRSFSYSLIVKGAACRSCCNNFLEADGIKNAYSYINLFVSLNK